MATQAIGYGLFGGGDVTSLDLQWQTGETTEVRSLGLSAHFPVGRLWRLGPRLRVDQRHVSRSSPRAVRAGAVERLERWGP